MTTQDTVIVSALSAADFDTVRTIIFEGFGAKQANEVNLSELSRWITDNGSIDFDSVGCLSDYADLIKARLISVWAPVDRSDYAEQVYKSFNTILQRTAKDTGIKLSITRARNGKLDGAKFQFDKVEVELKDYEQAAAHSKIEREQAEMAKLAAAKAEGAADAFKAAGLDPSNLPVSIDSLTKQADIMAAFTILLDKASPASRAKLAAMLAVEPAPAVEPAAQAA